MTEHKIWLNDWLQNTDNAVAYMEAAIDEGDNQGILTALRNVAEAKGGLAKVADLTGLSRETLYRTLSKNGNPQLNSLTAILQATGLRLSVKPLEQAV